MPAACRWEGGRFDQAGEADSDSKRQVDGLGVAVYWASGAETSGGVVGGGQRGGMWGMEGEQGWEVGRVRVGSWGRVVCGRWVGGSGVGGYWWG